MANQSRQHRLPQSLSDGTINMTDEDLTRIEQTFGVQLPHGYRQLLKSPPNLLVALMDAFAKEETELETPIYLNADVIIAANEEVRDPEMVFGPNDDLWDGELFVIGGDCGGNRYCIKPNSGSSTVYEWDHTGDCELDVYGETIPRYVERWFAELGEVAAMACSEDSAE